MYEVDDLDSVVEWEAIPPPDAGNPSPALTATEGQVRIAYFVSELDSSRWQSQQVEPSGMSHSPIAVVEIAGAVAHIWGPPNDEALHGHPLTSRGLEHYGVYLVENSSWIRLLEKRNRVHPRHADSPSYIDRLKHMIITFHDSTFECIFRPRDQHSPFGVMVRVVNAQNPEAALPLSI